MGRTRKKQKTRHSSHGLGPPSSLPDGGSLFTNRNVVQAFRMEEQTNPGIQGKACAEKLLLANESKWKSVNPQLPLIRDDNILKKICRFAETAKDYEWNRLSKVKSDNFIEKLDKLFDIAKCTCPIENCSSVECPKSKCFNGAHITCTCDKSDRIPVEELKYLLDQREKVGIFGGNMQMSSVDKDYTQKFLNKEKRKQKDTESTLKMKEKEKRRLEEARVSSESTEIFNVDLSEDDTLKDPDYFISQMSSSQQQRHVLDTFISEVIRYGISDRAAAAIHNAILIDYDLITDEKKDLVVDKSKIRRCKESFRRKQTNLQKEKVSRTAGIQCIGTDGKRNKKTKVKEIQVSFYNVQ